MYNRFNWERFWFMNLKQYLFYLQTWFIDCMTNELAYFPKVLFFQNVCSSLYLQGRVYSKLRTDRGYCNTLNYYMCFVRDSPYFAYFTLILLFSLRQKLFFFSFLSKSMVLPKKIEKYSNKFIIALILCNNIFHWPLCLEIM